MIFYVFINSKVTPLIIQLTIIHFLLLKHFQWLVAALSAAKTAPKAALLYFAFIFSVLNHALPVAGQPGDEIKPHLLKSLLSSRLAKRGSFALAASPWYWCVLCFLALISTTPSYYRQASSSTTKRVGVLAGRAGLVLCT